MLKSKKNVFNNKLQYSVFKELEGPDSEAYCKINLALIKGLSETKSMTITKIPYDNKDKIYK